MRFPSFNKSAWLPLTRKASATKTAEVNGTASVITTTDRVWHREPASKMSVSNPPDRQNVLLLKEPKQDYDYVEDADVPQLKSDQEILLRNKVIGLNPIDWKGPAFNFGLPELPCISGRELVGEVVRCSPSQKRLQPGDIVLSVSTDYRDSRKGAFQEYAVAYEFNSARLPKHLDLHKCAPIGVGFVTAAMALGICLGIDFSQAVSPTGPDLLKTARGIGEQRLPEDTREETLRGMPGSERPKKGDWLAIWGASSTVGFIALQIAKQAGLRVICIVDAVKHGSQLVEAGADVLVHRKDTEEAVSIVRAVTQNNLRYAVDAVGKETAALLQSTLRTSEGASGPRSHLTGLTGVPKEVLPGVVHHKVPIKLFHEIPEIGREVITWLEDLLYAQKLEAPKTLVREGGLQGVNDALQHLRSGECRAQRIVVPVQ